MNTDRKLSRRLSLKLMALALIMFSFGYLMVPLYKKLCTVTGINVVTKRDDVNALKNTQVDNSRFITIVFDSNARGPFRFKPEQNSIDVHPGQIAQISYEVMNTQEHAVNAQAIPSYAPAQAALYFAKLECFCFTQQTLAARQAKAMPVVFVIDPKLPKEITTITLSYTFFEIGTPAAITQSFNKKAA
jgi:cytochrome c oxidase assembly protein subunit 11